MLMKILLMVLSMHVDCVNSKFPFSFLFFLKKKLVSNIQKKKKLRFNKIYPKPNWATLPSEIKADRKRRAVDSDDEENEDVENEEDQLDEETRLDLLKSTIGILDRRSRKSTLPAKRLDILRLKNANRAAPKSYVSCVRQD